MPEDRCSVTQKALLGTHKSQVWDLMVTETKTQP
jgi:hypothetical protein